MFRRLKSLYFKSLTGLSVALIFLLGALTPADADLLRPGYHRVSITNVITNMADYPDYYFVSGPDSLSGDSPCSLEVVSLDGTIPHQYKFCWASVYAVPKTAVASMESLEAKIQAENKENTPQSPLLNMPGVKQVIKGVKSSEEVPDSDVLKSKKCLYEISMSHVLSEPTKVETPLDFLGYLYFVFPMVGIFIVQRRLKSLKRGSAE